mmetsp:Transcript_68915/g.199918  ORF Transcript_68915/g.199918 Transcript_68915/m.199918 type:complete len:200 (-) Transcript_68915:114-713(-)
MPKLMYIHLHSLFTSCTAWKNRTMIFLRSSTMIWFFTNMSGRTCHQSGRLYSSKLSPGRGTKASRSDPLCMNLRLRGIRTCALNSWNIRCSSTQTPAKQHPRRRTPRLQKTACLTEKRRKRQWKRSAILTTLLSPILNQSSLKCQRHDLCCEIRAVSDLEDKRVPKESQFWKHLSRMMRNKVLSALKNAVLRRHWMWRQ